MQQGENTVGGYHNCWYGGRPALPPWYLLPPALEPPIIQGFDSILALLGIQSPYIHSLESIHQHCLCAMFNSSIHQDAVAMVQLARPSVIKTQIPHIQLSSLSSSKPYNQSNSLFENLSSLHLVQSVDSSSYSFPLILYALFELLCAR